MRDYIKPVWCNHKVVITPVASHAISAVDAFGLAGITYRQLDYWARRGWVPPSIEPGTGRRGRRLYSPDDVVRLAALGHLGRSGADIAQLGPKIGALELPAGDYLVILGPGLRLGAVAANHLRARLGDPGSYVVFDPAPLRRRLGLLASPASPPASTYTALNQARTA
jgi:hypothetical protein